jgi:hypothetical protein
MQAVHAAKTVETHGPMAVQQAHPKTHPLDGMAEQGLGQQRTVRNHEVFHLRLNIGPAPLFSCPKLATEPRVLSMKYASVKHSPEFFTD